MDPAKTKNYQKTASQKAARTECQPKADRFKSDLSLREIRVAPIPVVAAKKVIKDNHYLHSFPGGTMLCFGVLSERRLLGALTLGVGPFHGYSLVRGGTRDDCVTLTRFWLSHLLPGNSESHVIGIVLRSLRQNSSLKFILAYADPSEGHFGTIYQASNWLYTGLSSSMSLYDFGDGIPRHSRSVGQILGSHSIKHFATMGQYVKLIPQSPKHRYIYFIDPRWRSRLVVPILPYPGKEVQIENI